MLKPEIEDKINITKPIFLANCAKKKKCCKKWKKGKKACKSCPMA